MSDDVWPTIRPNAQARQEEPFAGHVRTGGAAHGHCLECGTSIYHQVGMTGWRHWIGYDERCPVRDQWDEAKVAELEREEAQAERHRPLFGWE